MRDRLRLLTGVLTLTLTSLVAGCVTQTEPVQPTPVPPVPAANPEPDQATREALDYYVKIQDFYLATGRLRTDRAATDAPYDASDLSRNFLAIAFHEEFSDRGGALIARPREVRLQRWTGPVRIAVDFGASVSEDRRQRDLTEIRRLTGSLASLAGLPVSLVTASANFRIVIDNPRERSAIGARLLAFMPGASAGAVRSVAAMKADVYCTVFANTNGKSSTYDRAFVVIRAELPDLMRRSCLHEEIAQGFGLINDSPKARPSIFNDNEEFALLTRHDELLLKILYDPRLRPGMTLTEARPIVETIAAELMPGES